MTVRDQLASLIRTYVPIGVGFVLALLARKYDSCWTKDRRPR